MRRLKLGPAEHGAQRLRVVVAAAALGLVRRRRQAPPAAAGHEDLVVLAVQLLAAAAGAQQQRGVQHARHCQKRLEREEIFRWSKKAKQLRSDKEREEDEGRKKEYRTQRERAKQPLQTLAARGTCRTKSLTHDRKRRTAVTRRSSLQPEECSTSSLIDLDEALRQRHLLRQHLRDTQVLHLIPLRR